MPIIPIGFKHQLCIYHAKKSLNKQLKIFKDKNYISDGEYQEYHKQLKMIKDLNSINDYDEFKKEVKSLIYLKDEFNPFIYKIITKLIVSRYKNIIHHLKDKKIEKTMPKSRKRTFKTKLNILKRKYQRVNWNPKPKKKKRFLEINKIFEKISTTLQELV